MPAPFSFSVMYIVIGLGNPGTEYEKTRHNVGFMVVERLAQSRGISFSSKSKLARWGEVVISNEKVILAQPLTFMNNSGLAVKELLRMPGADPKKLMVVYDDLDLESGQIRVRLGGGSGGHKGIRSIMGQIGSEDFIRIRIGIGRPPGRQDPSNYVLSPFNKHQWEEVDIAIEKAMDAIVHVVTEGVVSAMNRFNRRDDANSQ